MKFLSFLSLGLMGVSQLWGADLSQSTFSQVVKDVKVVSRATETTSVAKLNDLFKSPDLIRTGADSLAELIADDKTITRVGANTVFSFEKTGRAINLEQGSVLFHSPKGKGGGTIRSKGASAAVLGTTIVVTATEGGGFKAILLEGKGQITLPNGDFRVLTAGQVTFVLPGSRTFGPTLNINLSKLVESSRLVQGFEKELPSKPVIQVEIERQNTLITTGQAEDTKKLVVNSTSKDSVNTVDSTVLEQAVKPADPLVVARANDVTISSSTALDSFTSQTFRNRDLGDLSGLGSSPFSGLVGRNITITSSQLDFTPFLAQPEFRIVADGLLKIQQPARTPSDAIGPSLMLTATLSELVQPMLKSVTFIGNGGIAIQQGYSIFAEYIGDLSFESGTSMSLNNVYFYNYSGQFELEAHGSLDVTGGGVTATTMKIYGSTVNLLNGMYCASDSALFHSYGGDLNLNGPTVIGNIISFEADNGTVKLENVNATATTFLNTSAHQDDVSISGGRYAVTGSEGTVNFFAGRDLALNSPAVNGFSTLSVTATRNLDVANGSFTGGNGNANAANLTAGETLSVNGTTLSGVANISWSARTLNLQNINFPGGSTVNLYSQLGQLAPNANTGAASVPGFVNFIVNVNYNGNPAQLYVGSTVNIAARR